MEATSVPSARVERRAQARTLITDCQARLQFTLLDRRLHRETEGVFPRVNLSTNGLMMLGRQSMEPGRTIRLRLATEGDRVPIQCRAEVIGSTKMTGRKVHRIGVRFSTVKKSSRDRLAALIRDPYSSSPHKKGRS